MPKQIGKIDEDEVRIKLHQVGKDLEDYLAEKYPGHGLFAFVVDPDGVMFHVIGNLCPCCVNEAIEEWIEKEGIDHPHGKELEKLVEKVNQENKRRVN